MRFMTYPGTTKHVYIYRPVININIQPTTTDTQAPAPDDDQEEGTNLAATIRHLGYVCVCMRVYIYTI